MELADYVGVLRRRWWMIALALTVCVVGAGVFSSMQPKLYSSSLGLLVPSSGPVQSQARTEASAAALSYAQLAMTSPAIAAATAQSSVKGTPVSVIATADGATPFLNITTQSSDPQAAQDVANAYVRVLPQIVLMLEKKPEADPPAFTILQPAGLPTTPSSPRPVHDSLIGAVLGLILGLAVALLREMLDGRIRDGVQLERAADVTLLGLVPKEFRTVPVPAMSRPRSRRSEAYRAVRTNLEFLSVSGMPRSIIVTSASAGEGKSSLTVNLGMVASRAGRDVVIIDADLRKPTVAEYFKLDSPIGLTDVLAGRWSIDEALQRVPGERLWVLSSGPVPTSPSELVGSAAMAALIEDFEQNFDFVIIDTPPILAVSDGLSLAVNVDGVVLVARMRETTKRSIQRAAQAVRRINATLLGVVGNAAIANGEDAVYGYGDGYRSRSKLNQADASEIATEVETLEAAGRRSRSESQPGDAPLTRRERRQGETRVGFEEVVNPPAAYFPSSNETAPGGLRRMVDVDLRLNGSAGPTNGVEADETGLRPRIRRPTPDTSSDG